jgi:hypothetical protein
MNQDIKKKWVEALRSGEYEQGKDQLRSSDDEFCCLGVLCDVAHKEGLGQWHLDDTAYSFATDRDFKTPPPIVVKWANLTGDNPGVEIQGEGTDVFFWQNLMIMATPSPKSRT